MTTLIFAGRGTPARRKPLLLVAGPSGGGKSTFVELLKAGRLSAEIARSLPPEAENWPFVTANFRKMGETAESVAAADAEDATGLIVHYDTTFPHRHGIHEYADDPALGILAQAERLIVANVTPPYEQLVAQFRHRQQRRHGTKSSPRQLWRQGVRVPMHRLRALLGGPSRETNDLYATQEWVRDCCAQWNAAVASFIRGKPGSVIVHVEPWPDARGDANFRLQRSTAATSALPASAFAMLAVVGFSLLD